MSVAMGQILAFLKIGSVAFVIMGILWLIIRAIENAARKKTKTKG